MPYDYSIIIPAYNEAGGIFRALQRTVGVFRALGRPFELIVVDDGSTDGTARIAEDAGRVWPEIRLLSHAGNQGKGAAVRTGVRAAAGGVILFFDADLATDPSAIHDFLPALQTADIAIGTRRDKDSVIVRRQPLYRILAGRLFNLLAVRWYLGLPFGDTQCGFKAFRRDVRPLFEELKAAGWSFDVEFLARARAAGRRIAEVPVAWRNGDGSRLRLRHALGILRELRRVKRLPSATGKRRGVFQGRGR